MSTHAHKRPAKLTNNTLMNMSPSAAYLIRSRYRSAADFSKSNGVLSALLLNDLDAGLGRWEVRCTHSVHSALDLYVSTQRKAVSVFPDFTANTLRLEFVWPRDRTM